MQSRCLITGISSAIAEKLPNGRDGVQVDSPRTLGPVVYAGSLVAMLLARNAETKRGFGRWIVERQLFGGLPGMLTASDWEAHKDHPHWTLAQKADRLFRWLATKERYSPLDPVVAVDEDTEFHEAFAVTDSTIEDELQLTTRVLAERGHLEYVDEHGDRTDGRRYTGRFRLSPSGWVAAEQRRGLESATAFIAMWFSSETETLRQAIIDTVSASGFEPIIIDTKDYTGLVVDEIMKEIRSARFVIADYTCGFKSGMAGEEHYQMRGGVYWEAGLALGRGLTVISTVRADLIDPAKRALHFDQAQFNHLTWSGDTLEEFKINLSNRIAALIGKGPRRPTAAS